MATLAQNWANYLATTQQPGIIPHPTSPSDRATYLTLKDANGNPCCNDYQGITGQNLAYGPGVANNNSDF